jgi:hypothetical protein
LASTALKLPFTSRFGSRSRANQEAGSADLFRSSLSDLIEDEWFLSRAKFENPTWREVVGLVTGTATSTEVDSIGQLNIGMALLTEARNRF